MKRILSSSIFLFFTLLTFSQSVKIDNIKYEAISATEAALVDGYEASGDVVIPEYVTIKGKKYKVVEIKEFAFVKDKDKIRINSGAKGLTSIIIPNSVVNIGLAAFGDCVNLKTIKLSEKLKTISSGVFYGCTSLTEIDIPYGVVSIEDEAFMWCTSLRSINIPNSVVKLGGQIFSGSDIKSLVIPNSVKNISSFALSGCESLESVVVPDRVSQLGYSFCMFTGCENLEIIRGHKTAYPQWIVDDILANQECYNNTLFRKVYIEDKRRTFTLLGHIEAAIEDGKISRIPTLEEYIKPKVETDINVWQKKGEFESTAKWSQRVNEITRNEKVKELADKYKGEYKLLQDRQRREYEAISREYYARKEEVKRELINPEDLSISTYDADNESFKISGFGITSTFNVSDGSFNVSTNPDILLPVNVDDAPSFKANWDNIKMTAELKFVPNGDDVALTSVSFKHNGKTYTYDSNTQAKYAITEIDYNFKPIELAINEGDNIDYTFNPLEEVQNVVASPRQDIAQNNNVVIERKKLSAGELSDVDVNVPVNSTNSTNTFAVIIGNENYSQVAKVPYAQNDAKVFAEYCEKTLGLPEKNIKCYNDATFGIMLSAIENIQNIAEAYKGNINVIFYYAGHGVPNESSNDAYLLPVDANGRNTTVCYPIGKLYDDLKASNAMRITVFLDACFSGAQRGDGMLASARGVAIKAKQAVPQGNMVVFTAASEDETAYPYDEKGHGLFTYYLLKKLKDTKGNVTLGELGNYICEKVAQEAVVTNGKSQTPTVVSSTIMGTTWKEWKLR